MAIKNLHFAQKDISTLEKELKKEEDLRYRTGEELKSVEG